MTTVRELIKALNKCDPDAYVATNACSGDMSEDVVLDLEETKLEPSNLSLIDARTNVVHGSWEAQAEFEEEMGDEIELTPKGINFWIEKRREQSKEKRKRKLYVLRPTVRLVAQNLRYRKGMIRNAGALKSE